MIITDKAQIKIAELRESNNLRLSGSDELECYELIESDLKLPADATFTRSSVAYLSDGTQVAANQPRFEQGKFGKAVLVEEGTENLYSFYSGLGIGGTEDLGAGDGKVKRVKITVNNPPGNLYWVTDIPISGGTKYTYSIWLKGDNIVSHIYLRDNTGKEVRLSTISLTDKWQKFSLTLETDISATSLIRASFLIPAGSVGIIYAADWQVEQKPYPTSFIDGARAAETLTIPTAGVLNPQEGTVECWVYVNSVVRRDIASNWPTVVLIRKGSSVANWIWLLHDFAGTWVLQIRKEDGTVTGWGSFNDSLTPDGWHYFAIRWNAQAGTADLFHNGVKRVSLTGVAFPAEYDRIEVGHRSGGSGDWLNSLIDDLRISSRVRTDAEILAAYQSGKPLLADEWTTYKLDFDDKVRITTQGQIICNEFIEI